MGTTVREEHPALMEDYREINRKSWNERTYIHLKSRFYDVEGFLQGKEVLNDIELELLGEVKGKRILHLQCHFGQDSLALARRGAQVTGIDFSDVAIAEAHKLNEQLNLDVEFICSDVYDTLSHIKGKFDIVFSSYGTIGWLPNLQKWTDVVSESLKPDGRLLLIEFHPTLWMFDERFKEIKYSYFNDGPIIEEHEGTYTDGDDGFDTKSMSWNHPFSEVVTALLQGGMQISSMREYDYSPYPCFNDLEEISNGKWQIKGLAGKMPMVYALCSSKRP